MITVFEPRYPVTLNISQKIVNHNMKVFKPLLKE
jgi:hypothetical protein